MPADNEFMTLVQMPAGRSGTVVQIVSRHGRRYHLGHRLEALGIRPGKKITKISSAFMRGPVTIEVDRSQVAIGFGIAKRILVELE